METFNTKSTSRHSLKVIEPIVLKQTNTTRKVFKAEINDKKQDVGETVGGVICYQKKNKSGEWESVDAIKMNTLKSGDGVRVSLSSEELKLLHIGMEKLYAISKEGIPYGDNTYVVGKKDEFIYIPEHKKQYIQKLLEANMGEEFWKEFEQNNPDLATHLSNVRINQNRTKALKEFENSLTDDSKNEGYWQKFFEKNEWIFGYGLNYQFLSLESTQPNYGGERYDGTGKQKGDYLTKTNANAKFTVLVEIKKPYTNLISKSQKAYRNGAWLLSGELLGGVSQVQANCNTWSKTADNVQNRELINNGVFTVQPKGILIIGNTSELKGDDSKVTSFELFRRNLNNLEIITYDELLERARFILGSEPIIPKPENSTSIEDDLPF